MKTPHFIASLACAAGFSWAIAAHAATINLVGTFGSKALVSINGAAPKKMAPGEQSPEGILLVSVNGDSATFELDGQRRTLKMGQHYAPAGANANKSIILGADSRGHFVTQGAINGAPTTFMVDTGASMVAISADNARRMNLKYTHGKMGWVGTANGSVPAYQISLDTVSVGGVTLSNVEAVITEAPMPYVLLGMSFLNRMEMKRSGEQMILTRRY